MSDIYTVSTENLDTKFRLYNITQPYKKNYI